MSYTKRVTPYTPEPPNSRLDSYERSDGAIMKGSVNNWWHKFRTPSQKYDLTGALPRLDIDVIERYKLKNIIFGNWVKNFDRLNFSACLGYALADLQTVIGKVDKGLGKGKLTVDWGGRGKKGALGLYYSGDRIINLRRFSRPDKLLKNLQEAGQDTTPYINKYFEPVKGQGNSTNYQLNDKGYIWALGSSGFGSFAHEYGHFLDNILGGIAGAKSGFLSGTGVLPTAPELDRIDIERAFYPNNFKVNDFYANYLFIIFLNLYYDKKVKTNVFGKVEYYTPSKNLINLVKYCQNTGGKELYWLSFIEVWARVFESYTQYVLSSKGIENMFLVSDAKKFEVQVKIIDGKEITKEVGRLCYPSQESIKKYSKDIKNFLDIFATT
jgi:hypothetical protein